MKVEWEEKRLDEVYDVRDGTHASPKFHLTGYPFITSKNLKNGTLNFDKIQYISKKDYIEYNKRSKVDKGDILFAMIGTLGNPVVVEVEPNFAIKNVALIKVPKNQSNYFLKYYLDSQDVVDKIYRDARGTTQKFVGLGNLRKFKILLPPLAEQQRIVSVLDEAFASIAQAKSNAERNLSNIRDVFESILREIFSNGDNWDEKALGEITEVQSGGTPLRSIEKYWSGNIPWYSSGELNNLYTEEPERKITKFGLDNSNAKIFPMGSLLMGMYDTAALKMSILDRDATFNQAVAGAKPNSEIDLKFVMYAIRVIKPEILNQRRGVRQKNLSLEKIKNIPINLPPLAEQRTIVGRLEALSAETSRLEAVYKSKLAALDELKKSILAKAFAGEL